MRRSRFQSDCSTTARLRSGQALVPVIFLMLILTVLAVAFVGAAVRELRSGSNFSRQMQRFYAARGAVNYAAAALAQTSNNGATYGVVQPSPDSDANGWMPVGDAWVKIEVVDTGAFLSLNGADETALKHLPLFKNSPDLLAALLDWRSASDQPSQNGAKSEYYQTLPMPYDSKNGPFDTVEELLLVKGFTPAILYGNAGGNPIPPSAEAGGEFVVTSGYNPSGATRQATVPGGQPSGGQNGGQTGGQAGGQNGTGNGSGNGQTGSEDPNAPDPFEDIFSNSKIPLAELLTTTARERNIAADGSARVNINKATEQDLRDKLGLTDRQVQSLIAYRSGNLRPGGNTNGGINNSPGGPGGPGGGFPGGPGGGPRPRPDGNGGGPRPRPGGFGGNGGFGNGGFFPRSVPLSRRSRQAGPGQGGGNSGGGNGNPGGNGSGGSNSGGNGQNAGGNGSGSGQSQSFRTPSDLLDVDGFTRSVMQKIADKIATDDKPYRENVVNINTAPAEVLATVPGMTRNALDAILNYRQGGKTFQTIGDLFALQELQRTDFQQILGTLTTKSSAYWVRVKVRIPGQQGVYAVMAQVEMTSNGPRTTQWREVPRLPGWALWLPPAHLNPPGTGNSPQAADE